MLLFIYFFKAQTAFKQYCVKRTQFCSYLIVNCELNAHRQSGEEVILCTTLLSATLTCFDFNSSPLFDLRSSTPDTFKASNNQ